MRILALIIILACVTGCSRKPAAGGAPRGSMAPVPVNIGEVVRKDMPVDLPAIGNVEAIATVGIKAQVGGELLEVNFKEGQDVKKGELLFSIQPKLYATQLAQAQANLARDRAAAANARREAERQEELAGKGVASKEELDKARTQAEALEATVKADEAMVEIARVQFGYATIESPIDGRTGALKVQAGNLIKASADEPMVTIRQLMPIYVSFAVPEQHLAEIQQGMSERKLAVTALDPKSGKLLAHGDLTFIDNVVDTTTGTVMLKATFTNEDHALWPGAFVDVALRLRMDTGVTVAPAAAVTIGQRGPQVFVVKDDGSAELRSVVLERMVGQEAIIQKGVQPGEKIVTNGQSRLVSGVKVIVKPAAENASDTPPVEAKGART